MIYLNKNELKALTPQSQIFGVIGVLMNNPAKLLSDSVCLTKEDFSNSVHQTVMESVTKIRGLINIIKHFFDVIASIK